MCISIPKHIAEKLWHDNEHVLEKLKGMTHIHCGDKWRDDKLILYPYIYNNINSGNSMTEANGWDKANKIVVSITREDNETNK